MKCVAFQRWLDDGRPAVEEAAFLIHAGGCPACAAAWSAALAVEAALAAPGPAAPPQFTQQVMARVRAAKEDHAWDLGFPDSDALPWWARAAAQPAAALALLLSALLAWHPERLWSIASRLPALSRGVASRAGLSLQPLLAHFSSRWSIALLSVLAASALLWASWQLYGWIARLNAAPLRERPFETGIR